MNRIVATLLFLLAAPAAAQNAAAPAETIEVDAAKTLTGLWKISFPAQTISISLPLAGTRVINYQGGDTFCRLEQQGESAAMACLAGGNWRTGTASLDGNNLHLAWGSALLRLVVDAPLNGTSTFAGPFAVKLMGISKAAPEPAAGTHFDNLAGSSDTAGKTPLLTTVLAQMAGGGITVPHDAAIASNFVNAEPNKPSDMAKLGKLETIIYVGESRLRWGRQPSEPFLFSVYQVEFTGGQRLCGIHQRDDGVLDGFLCV